MSNKLLQIVKDAITGKKYPELWVDLLGDETSYARAFSPAANVPATATLQSAATGTGNGTSMDVSGMATLMLQTSGAFVATLVWEASVDDCPVEYPDRRAYLGNARPPIVWHNNHRSHGQVCGHWL
jgi:hypothetical protein